MNNKGNKTRLDISVIIPTRNRAAMLDQVLESLTKQTFTQERYELIVVDNGSTDNTAAICKKWKHQFINFRYIYDAHPGIHIGRNRGCMEAKSDLLVYGDDDLFPEVTWLEGMYKGLTETDAVLVGGSIFPKYEQSPDTFLKKMWQTDGQIKMMIAFSCIIFPNCKRYVDPQYIFGCSFGVRKEIIVSAGGFHPDGMPDQYMMYRGDGETYIARYIRKKGLKALVMPEISAKHFVTKARMSEERIAQVGYRNGISDAYRILRESPTKLSLVLNITSTLFRTLKEINSSPNPVVRREKRERYKGIIFLIKQYTINKHVREWIRREDYFCERGYIPN